MSSGNSTLTVRQATLIAARSLAVFFAFWAVLNLLELPGYITGLTHYAKHGDGASTGTYYTYWTSRYAGFIAGVLLKSIVELWIARLFYGCGPKVIRFFLDEDLVEDVQPSSSEMPGRETIT